MSIKVMTHVWDGFPASGSELLAMLALADWCDDSGRRLHPSIKAVSEKVRVQENHARKILRKFEQDNFLAVVGNHSGGKPGTTREYRLNVGRLKLLADEANAKKEAEKAAKYGSKKSAGDHWDDVFLTPPLQDTPILEDGPTPPLQHRDAPPAAPTGPSCSTETPPLQRGLTTIEPSIDPSITTNKNTYTDTVEIPVLVAEKQKQPVAPKKSAKQESSIAKPDGVTDSVWSDFKTLRTAKKAPLTNTALTGIGREAGIAGISLNDALAVCCERGWQSFKADWLDKQGSKPAAMTASNRTSQSLSFAERDRIAGMQRWEESCNQRHPDLPAEYSKFGGSRTVIDITPLAPRIAP